MTFDKNEFLDAMRDICNLSEFHLLCLFYDLEKGAQAVKMSDIMNLLASSKPNKKSLQ